QFVQSCILAAVSGKHGERNATLLRQAMQRREPVGPIGFAADQAHQNAARAWQGPFDIGVDGQWMPQFAKIGEPQRRQAAASASPAGRKGRKIAVRERERHQIGRILAEIPWRRGLLKSAALAKDNVHQMPSPVRIAVSSMSPCSPITTSFDCRGVAPQGASNWCRTRSPTACRSSRIGLSLMAIYPLARSTF